MESVIAVRVNAHEAMSLFVIAKSLGYTVCDNYYNDTYRSLLKYRPPKWSICVFDANRIGSDLASVYGSVENFSSGREHVNINEFIDCLKHGRVIGYRNSYLLDELTTESVKIVKLIDVDNKSVDINWKTINALQKAMNQ